MKGEASASGSAKKRRAITLEVKMDIIMRLEKGEKMAEVARKFNMNRSTVCMILKSKEKIVKHVKSSVTMQSTIISKKGGRVIEAMEKQLGLWIKDCIQKRKPLCLAVIQEKARSLFNTIRTEYSDEVSFVATHGWFNRFKALSNLHNVVFVEAASVDSLTHSLTATKEFPHILEEIFHQGNYTPQQIFNVNETGLYWKKMPDCAFFS